MEREYMFKMEEAPETRAPENVDLTVYTDGENFYVEVSGPHFAVNDFLRGDPESTTHLKELGRQLTPRQKPGDLEKVDPMLERQAEKPVAADGGQKVVPDPTKQHYWNQLGDDGYTQENKPVTDGGENFPEECDLPTMDEVDHKRDGAPESTI